jgi:hypothetical protein
VITALHVIAGIEGDHRPDKRIVLRVNTHGGGFDHYEIKSEQWVRPDHSDGIVDAAVCYFPPNNRDHFDYTFVGDDQVATTDVLNAEDIGVGNDVYFAGLFINHYGKHRNEPIVRSGTIASMPLDPVSTKGGPMHAYLVESRSIGGLSGSPVFVDAGFTRHDAAGKLQFRAAGSGVSYLLGVMSGHWDASAEIKRIGDVVSREVVNMGIAIVTPIDNVLPLVREAALSD